MITGTNCCDATIDPCKEMENHISSEVLTLRPYKESDADDFLCYAGDDQVTRFTRWNTFSSKEEALVYIKDFCIPHPYCRSICLNDRSIGFVFIRPESGDDRCRAEIGYATAAKYWGQGVTTRALKMAISDGLKSFPDVLRLQARVEVENKASQRVLEKLGFLKEGVLRKYMYNKAKGYRPHPGRRSICLDDRSIGYISIFLESGDDRCRANFGYALTPEYWGQGIATVASKMAVSSVFQDLPYLVRLQALVQAKHRSSQRVLEKVGFVKEGKYGYLKGEIRDILAYSFLSTDLVL